MQYFWILGKLLIHKVLLAKLSKFNFCDGAMTWVESYLTNRSQSVSIDNHRSKLVQLLVSHKDPFLVRSCSAYILTTVCPEVETIMYADNTVLFVHGRSKADDADTLTRSMAKVTSWLQECCLQLNVSKTVSMFFCKTNRSTSDHHIMVEGAKLQVVSEFKYLGVLIDSQCWGVTEYM